MKRSAALLAVALLASTSLRDKGLRAQEASSGPAPSPPAPLRRAMFGGDARHTGRSALRGPAREPAVRWRARSTRRIFASPVVDAQRRAVVGSLDGALMMVDAEGVTRAAVSLPTRIFSSAAAVRDLVVFGHDAHAFVALDARGGSVWSVPTSQDADAPPVVGDDGTLYLASDALLAVNLRGETRWRRPLDAHAFGAPAVAGDAVVCTDLQGGITWVARADGALRRRVEVGAPIFGGALVLDDLTVVVAAGDGHLRAYAPDGAPRWDHPTDGAAHGAGARSTPALRRDGVIVFGAEDGGIYGVRAADGSRVFKLATGYPVRSSALIDRDDVAYVGGEDDFVRAVNPDGTERWRVSLGADVDSSPTLLEDGLLVVGCDDGGLYALGEAPPPRR
jgi:outer membrane protein assembly factor BamB